MPDQSTSPFDPEDLHRLALAAAGAREAAAVDVAGLLPAVGQPAVETLRRSCRFAHRAVLLFPSGLDAALDHFADLGLDPVAPVPSVLVRRRLCDRYGLAHDACDVTVTRLRSSTRAGNHDLEVFLFPRTAPALHPSIVEAERRFGFEDHLALEDADPDEAVLGRLLGVLGRDAGLAFEGGGHNPHEGTTGTTVLYFAGRAGGSGLRRFELSCRGDFSALVGRQRVAFVAA